MTEQPEGEPALTMDPAAQTAELDGRRVALTGTEYRLLETLLREPERTFSRAELIEAAAGGAVVLERTIDVHVAALHRKLGRPDLIQTIRRAGYRLGRS